MTHSYTWRDDVLGASDIGVQWRSERDWWNELIQADRLGFITGAQYREAEVEIERYGKVFSAAEAMANADDAAACTIARDMRNQGLSFCPVIVR